MWYLMHDAKDASLVRTILGQGELEIGELCQWRERKLVVGR